VWALVGAAAYVIYRPHGAQPAAVIVIAAGLYELAPLKRYFRRRCRDGAGSGLRYGLCCTGSSIGLMAMLLALGVMSIAWMVVISAVVTAQKLLPGKAAVDVPIGLVIVGLGAWIAVAPSMIPGLLPAM
jgi:predicted metal-binding membrane protein